MSRPHPAPPSPAGSHRSPGGTWAPPTAPGTWPPRSGRSCRRSWARRARGPRRRGAWGSPLLAPGAPLLAATRRYASLTIGLGIANGLSLGFGMFPRFLPGPEPRLTEPNIPGEPAPWLPRHPRKQRVHGYYGPVRRRAPRRYSVPSVSASARSLSRPSGACCDPGRRIDARLLTFRARAADQAHAAFTPGTAWPVHGYPPGSSRRVTQGPRFRCRLSFFRRLNGARPAGHPGGAVLERLPGPHLTRSRRAFSRIAHHDSLQLTQHRVV